MEKTKNGLYRAENGLYLVKFTKNWKAHRRGSTAGFLLTEAKRLVNGDYATFDIKDEGLKPANEAKKADPPENGGGNGDDDQVDKLDALIKEFGDGWRTAHHAKLKLVSSEYSEAPIMNKDEAVAAIEAELELRADDGNSPPENGGGNGGE